MIFVVFLTRNHLRLLCFACGPGTVGWWFLWLPQCGTKCGVGASFEPGNPVKVACLLQPSLMMPLM